MKYMLLLLLTSVALADISPMLIGGTPVPDGTRPDIVRITSQGAGCTASVVGKRVVLTASHCVNNGATATFKTLGKQYSGKAYRSPIYPGKDHDIAVVITTEDVDLGGKPFSVIGGVAEKDKTIDVFGYGCTQIGGGGGNDGVLRTGKAKISGFSNYDLVSKAAPAALCYGDSGGPAYIDCSGKLCQISVNSKGNIKDTNYQTRTDTEESKKFFEDIVATHKVDICGVNSNCAGTPPEKKFTVENSVVKADVTVKGELDLEFVKRHFDMLLLFLEGDKPTDIVHPITPAPQE